MRYLIIGPLPTPYGGVSVYVKRLSRVLEQTGIAVDVFDFKKEKWTARFEYCLRILLDPRYGTIELEVPYWWAMLILCLRPIRTSVRFYDHRWTDVYRKFGPIQNFILHGFLLRCSDLRVVESSLRAFYPKRLQSRVHVEPAYIKPDFNDRPRIEQRLGLAWQQFRRQHSPIIALSAHALRAGQEDLYGVTDALLAVSRLRSEFPHLGMVILFGILSEDERGRLNQQLGDLGLLPEVHIMRLDDEVWPLFLQVDLLLRATSKDGPSISVLEALDCGCSVLASDVAERDPRAHTYRTLDRRDLTLKARDIMREAVDTRSMSSVRHDQQDHRQLHSRLRTGVSAKLNIS